MKRVLIFLIATVVASAGFAQTDHGKIKDPKKASAGVITYICPMHSEVVSDKPGKCPKCGMNLVEKKKEIKKTYTCPMHSEIKSDKPGKCPKCGMNLVEKKTK
jgi:putative DNA topoisomerase